MYIPKQRKLASGKWFIQMRLGGKSICVSDFDRKACINKAHVVKAEYKLKQKNKASKQSKKSSYTLTELEDLYISNKSNVLSPSTIRGYRTIQEHRFQTIKHTRIADIDPSDWQRLINEESAICEPKTLKNALGFIRTVIETQTEIRLPKNLSLPALIRTERAFLQPDEIKSFIAAIKDEPLAVPALLALSSLRISEIAALRWEDIPEDPQFIKVAGAVVLDENNVYVKKRQNKNISSARNVPIYMPELKAAIARDRKPEGAVLGDDQRELREAVHKACKKAGVTDVSVHGLRHSFASLAYHLGVPERITMEIGGWSDPGTVNKIYTHIAKTDMEHYQSEMANFYASDKPDKSDKKDDPE